MTKADVTVERCARRVEAALADLMALLRAAPIHRGNPR